MRRDSDSPDERFAAYVRERGERHLRVAVLLTGDWHAAEDLVQASLVKLHRAWPRLATGTDPDAYLRRIMINTHRSWWRARWRRETPAAVLPERPWGRFDPASGTGEQSDNLGAQVRSTGGHTYILLTDLMRDSYASQGHPVPAWASWERLPLQLQPGTSVSPAGLALLGTWPVLLGQAGPQELLGLLQSATNVREVGPVSGPGWTGTAYSFRAATALKGTLRIPVSTTGTVDVDQQGLVRRLDAQESFEGTVRHITITFGDFGLPVTVSPPPASATWTPPA